MQAGLFICDDVDPKYQDQFGNYPEMYARLFPEFQFQLYHVYKGQFPKDLEDCDVYLATGSRYSVYQDLDWIIRLKKVIRAIYEQEKYFLGFCFGHQLLGEALGGKVEKALNGWCAGVHEFDVQQRKTWMQPFQHSINVLMMCQDQVVVLPNNATVLMSNEKCPIGMFQVGERMLGIQGHPEFSKEYDQFLIEQRINKSEITVIEKGIKSLKKEIDAAVIRNWMLQFLNHVNTSSSKFS